MKNKTFVFVTLLLIVLSFISYFFIVSKLLIPKNEYYTYKQYLLESINSNKIVIYGGSNASYGINPITLEQRYHMPVVSIADSGGYPFRDKIYNIEKHVRKGDVIIFSLEWLHYSRAKIRTSDYVDFILRGWISFYYHNLPWYEKLGFVYQDINLKNLEELITREKNEDSSGNFSKLDSFLKMSDLTSGSRGEVYEYKDKKGVLLGGYKEKKCNQYLFKYQSDLNWELSEEFKDNIHLLKRLKSQGVKVIFIYPTVVGKDCYQTMPTINDYALKIKRYLNHNGFDILGEPVDSLFTQEYLYNTYYHVTKEGMEKRTQSLVDLLSKYDLDRGSSDDGYFKTLLKNKIKSDLNKDINSYAKAITPLKARKKYSFKSNQLIFIGWSFPEEAHRWSLNTSSKIKFKFSDVKDSKGLLSFDVGTLGKQFIKLTINGHYIGEKELNSGHATLQYKFEPSIIYTDKLNTITLSYPNAKQPNEMDLRVLAIALKSMKIE